MCGRKQRDSGRIDQYRQKHRGTPRHHDTVDRKVHLDRRHFPTKTPQEVDGGCHTGLSRRLSATSAFEILTMNESLEEIGPPTKRIYRHERPSHLLYF